MAARRGKMPAHPRSASCRRSHRWRVNACPPLVIRRRCYFATMQSPPSAFSLVHSVAASALLPVTMRRRYHVPLAPKSADWMLFDNPPTAPACFALYAAQAAAASACDLYEPLCRTPLPAAGAGVAASTGIGGGVGAGGGVGGAGG